MAFGINTPDLAGAYIKGSEAATNDAYKRAMMQSTINAQQLNREKFEQDKLMKNFENVYKYNIQPAFKNLQDRADSKQEEYDALSNQFKQDYPWLENVVGKNWNVYKRPDNGLNIEVDYSLTKDDIASMPPETQKYLKVGQQVRLKRDANTGQIDLEDIGRQVEQQQAIIQQKKRSGKKKLYNLENIPTSARQAFNNDLLDILGEPLEKAKERINAYYKLAGIREKQGQTEESEYLKDRAEELNKVYRKVSSGNEFMSLIEALRNKG